MESNRLRQIIKEIQYKRDLTIGQIAEFAGYTRVHLTKELKKGKSPKVEAKLMEVFKEDIQNVAKTGSESIQSKNPGNEPGSPLLQAKDEIIQLLRERDNLQKTVNDFSGKISTLSSEVAELKDLLYGLAKFFDPDEVSGAGLNMKKGSRRAAP
jgi:hypothetical protein